MMRITCKKGFLAMFYFLEEMYFNDTSQGDLGALLGDLNPNLFSDGMSADIAAWRDWEGIFAQVNTNTFLNSQEVYQAVEKFLEMYQSQYGFNITRIIEEIKNSNKLFEKWEQVIDKVGI